MEKQKLNTTVVYILSTFGLICCCVGGLGFIPSGIGYFLAHNKLTQYHANPEEFENPKGMQTAKIIAIVVLLINLAYLAFTIYRIYTIGWDNLLEQSREMMDQWGGMEQVN